MVWKLIEGYAYPYRISDEGEAQKQLENGTWKTIRPYYYNGQYRVHLRRLDGTVARPSVSGLVADHFMGGTPPGMCRVHKNGMKTDNAVENIIFMTRQQMGSYSRPGNATPVVKVNKRGQVVGMYSSQVEAAEANFISQQAVSRRCNGLVRHPYRLDGHNYMFEDDYYGIRKKRGRPKKNAQT